MVGRPHCPPPRFRAWAGAYNLGQGKAMLRQLLILAAGILLAIALVAIAFIVAASTVD